MTTIEAFIKQAAKRLEELGREAAGGKADIEEQDRIARRARDSAAELAQLVLELVDQAAGAALAAEHPWMICSLDNISVKKGAVKLSCVLPLAAVPPLLFAHDGRLHVRLIEGQIDWLQPGAGS